MARILLTGSTDGIGLAAASLLSSQGHHVTLHARNASRAEDALSAVPKAKGCLIADLSSISEMKRLAEEANKAGPWDAVIHNAGVGPSSSYQETSDGIATTFAVNSLAPYVLTCLMDQPKRLLYTSSGLHTGGDASLKDIAWTSGRSWDSFQAYSDTKLHNVLLANAVSRLWPDVHSCSFDPGWVKTKMGGGGAPGSVNPPAKTIAAFASATDTLEGKSGAYIGVQGIKAPKSEAQDTGLQDRYLKQCFDLSGVKFPS